MLENIIPTYPNLSQILCIYVYSSIEHKILERMICPFLWTIENIIPTYPNVSQIWEQTMELYCDIQ